MPSLGETLASLNRHLVDIVRIESGDDKAVRIAIDDLNMYDTVDVDVDPTTTSSPSSHSTTPVAHS